MSMSESDASPRAASPHFDFVCQIPNQLSYVSLPQNRRLPRHQRKIPRREPIERVQPPRRLDPEHPAERLAGLVLAHRQELHLEQEPPHGRRVEGVHGVGGADERPGVALHPGQHFVDLGDFPRGARAGAVAQQGVGLVDDEKGAGVGGVGEGADDLFLALADPHREEVLGALLDHVEAQARREIAGVGALAGSRQAVQAEGDRRLTALTQAAGQGRQVAVGLAEGRIEGHGAGQGWRRGVALDGLDHRAGRSMSALPPPVSLPRRTAASITAGEARTWESSSSANTGRRSLWRPAIRSTTRRRTARPGSGKRMARDMRRSTAAPRRSLWLVIHTVGAGVCSTSRFMNTFEPTREPASSSSTPVKMSSASSTTSRVLPARPASARPMAKAATRAARVGSPSSSSISPMKVALTPRRSARVRANSVLPVPGEPWSRMLTPSVRLARAAARNRSARSAASPRCAKSVQTSSALRLLPINASRSRSGSAVSSRAIRITVGDGSTSPPPRSSSRPSRSSGSAVRRARLTARSSCTVSNRRPTLLTSPPQPPLQTPARVSTGLLKATRTAAPRRSVSRRERPSASHSQVIRRSRPEGGGILSLRFSAATRGVNFAQVSRSMRLAPMSKASLPTSGSRHPTVWA